MCVLIGTRDRPNPLLGLEGLKRCIPLAEVVIGEAQLEVRKVRDDFHPVGADPSAGVSLSFDGLIELFDRFGPIQFFERFFRFGIVLVPGIGKEGGGGEQHQKNGEDREREVTFHES